MHSLDNISLMQYLDHHGTGEFWGKLTANGSWDGLVGMLAREEADIALANLFVTDVKGRTEFQEYTSPHGQVVRAHQSLYRI